ncbi:hypothetical protein MLD38_040006 [Melastoma candidum]|uniref:Uncharacterized protein n=1 Tax=Melastoma candidum TaxID=119954 RepID=A0ACB9L3W1_9MYRT|nr:hypothetical protein MLD38_040006 [Melastoma candidum]
MAMAPVPSAIACDSFAKDAAIAWFKGEFAAANAIIDALCSHLSQLGAGYDGVFEAVHRRRMNWIPVLQMQKYLSIADIEAELSRVGTGCVDSKCLDREKGREGKQVEEEEEEVDANGNAHDVAAAVDAEEEDDSPNSDITDSGSHEAHPVPEKAEICARHDECEGRAARIRLTKGFVAKEPVKGHMVNVVKGLKLYEDVFNDLELEKLTDFVNEVRTAGHNGELSGDTFILFNKQMKGNKRELIQFGVPIFGRAQEESPDDNKTGNIEPIPALLQRVVDHLVEWQLIPTYKKPNSCIINFFDEGESSQPFLKPPHLDQPISTLLLSDSTMVFGRFLVSNNEGNYKGPLLLSLKKGSLVVMRGNSADMARHVMCPGPNKRVAITFFRVRPDSHQVSSPKGTSPTGVMTLWQPQSPSTNPNPNGALTGYEALDMIPPWGILHAPVVMLAAAPIHPMVLSPRKVPQEGTGVFLPWSVSPPRKHVKHLPPRAKKGRFLTLQSPGKPCVSESTSCIITSEGNSISP